MCTSVMSLKNSSFKRSLIQVPSTGNHSLDSTWNPSLRNQRKFAKPAFAIGEHGTIMNTSETAVVSLLLLSLIDAISLLPKLLICLWVVHPPVPLVLVRLKQPKILVVLSVFKSSSSTALTRWTINLWVKSSWVLLNLVLGAASTSSIVFQLKCSLSSQLRLRLVLMLSEIWRSILTRTYSSLKTKAKFNLKSLAVFGLPWTPVMLVVLNFLRT